MKKMSKLEGPKIVDTVDNDNDEETPHEYEVEDAMHTLEKAEKIKKDKRLMPHVHMALKKKITSLKELKQLGLKKSMEDRYDEGEE